MTKEEVQADLWLKDVAPSAALRKWFAHDRSKWEAFKSRYFLALDAEPEALARLLDEAAKDSGGSKKGWRTSTTESLDRLIF